MRPAVNRLPQGFVSASLTWWTILLTGCSVKVTRLPWEQDQAGALPASLTIFYCRVV